LNEKNEIFRSVYHHPGFNFNSIYKEYLNYGKIFSKYICNTALLLNDATRKNKDILFEGAQGTFLDIDFGTYPFVTSSSATSGGACIGTGVPPVAIDKVIGVAKAYTTRVGEGPFPTEFPEDFGEFIRTKGHEFGATTGRPRRCGWFDAVVAPYSVAIGGIDTVALLHLDTLTGLDELKVCIGYEIDGARTTFFPANIARLVKARCIYQTLAGWKEDITQVKDFDRLPPNAQNYVAFLEKCLKKPVTMIGVGPNRNQTIFLPSRH
jgi:adenylosuccinate synthase